MDALYTEEERMVRSAMREFADAELAPNAARWDESEEFPWASVEAMKVETKATQGLPAARREGRRTGARARRLR